MRYVPSELQVCVLQDRLAPAPTETRRDVSGLAWGSRSCFSMPKSGAKLFTSVTELRSVNTRRASDAYANARRLGRVALDPAREGHVGQKGCGAFGFRP